jgi:hypothetical protein
LTLSCRFAGCSVDRFVIFTSEKEAALSVAFTGEKKRLVSCVIASYLGHFVAFSSDMALLRRWLYRSACRLYFALSVALLVVCFVG